MRSLFWYTIIIISYSHFYLRIHLYIFLFCISCDLFLAAYGGDDNIHTVPKAKSAIVHSTVSENIAPQQQNINTGRNVNRANGNKSSIMFGDDSTPSCAPTLIHCSDSDCTHTIAVIGCVER